MYRGGTDQAQVQIGDAAIAVEIGRRIMIGITDALAGVLIHDQHVAGGFSVGFLSRSSRTASKSAYVAPRVTFFSLPASLPIFSATLELP